MKSSNEAFYFLGFSLNKLKSLVSEVDIDRYEYACKVITSLIGNSLNSQNKREEYFINE